MRCIGASIRATRCSITPASKRWCRTAARCACSTACWRGANCASNASAVNHRDAAHPLRTRSGLLATAAIEYAAQAAALHGALLARQAGAERGARRPGERARRSLAAGSSTTCPTQSPDALRIVAERQAGDAGRLLYAFSVAHGGREIATGDGSPSSSTVPGEMP